MKKLLITACAVACAASVIAQGTVNFNNRVVGSVLTHVYLGAAPGQQGNGTADTPAGTKDWTGFALLSGSGYSAALLGATGSAVAESSLSFGASPNTITFRTGAAAGQVNFGFATVNSVAPDSAFGTFEMFAWDNKGGTVTDPNVALSMWQQGTLAAGKSGAFTVASIGGSSNPAPNLVGLQSFSIYIIPEPSTMALAGLGAAALLIFRRRK